MQELLHSSAYNLDPCRHTHTHTSGGPQNILPKKSSKADAKKAPAAARPTSAEPAKVARGRSQEAVVPSKPPPPAFTPTKSPPCKRSKSRTDPSEFSGKSCGSGSTTSDGRSTRTSSSTEGFYSRARRFSPDFGALACNIATRSANPQVLQTNPIIKTSQPASRNPSRCAC